VDVSEAGTVRTGVHVQPGQQSGCLECGHPRTMHRNGTTPCKAAGCHAGPDGGPCEGFVTASASAAPELLAS
jgi:hypothetical protein